MLETILCPTCVAAREARARARLADYRRQLEADPENAELATWVRRYEDIVAGYEFQRMIDRAAKSDQN